MESYNSNARLRDKSTLESWKYDELQWFRSFFESTEGVPLLDVGAGSGQHSEWLQAQGFEVLAIDSSAEMINCCRGRGLNVRVMDFYDIALEEGSFAAVWSMNALLHVPKKSLPVVLRGVRKIMKPAGLFYLGLYGGRNSEGIWLDDPYTPNRYFSSYTDEDIQAEVAKYYEILHFKVTEMPGDSPDYQSMILRKPRE
jgi:SAM-dependent methyltransferase